MPYITSIERLGRADGLKEGTRKGMLDALRVGLRVRFAEQGLALMPELEVIQDEAVLIHIQEALVRGLSLEELRKIWQG